MLYTPMTKKAMQIAFEAHRDQTDKNGIPYIYHPIHLAEQMKDEAAICVALLHDVAEDTDMTFEQLEQEGFSKDIIDALKLLTHVDSVPYMDYVREIKTNPLAATVKLADLRHNSDLTRLDIVDDKAIKRVEKYKKAIELLTGSAVNRKPCRRGAGNAFLQIRFPIHPQTSCRFIHGGTYGKGQFYPQQRDHLHPQQKRGKEPLPDP